jgi:CheY-like chemotaxis protein
MAQPGEAVDEALEDDPERAGVAVLAVEDEETAQRAIDRVLSRDLDANVEAARSVAEAIDELEAHPYDVVVMDHELPDGTGLDGLAHVRELRPGVPVIYLTGRGDEAIAEQALSQGAVEYLAKGPDAYQRLSRVVERACRRWGDLDRLVEPGGRASEPAGVDGGLFDELVDRTHLEGVLVHDPTGRVVLSTLPDDWDEEVLAARAAAWGHHSAQLAEATVQDERGALGLMRGTESLLATMGAPGRLGLVGVFHLEARPPHALRTLTEAAQLVRDEFSGT